MSFSKNLYYNDTIMWCSMLEEIYINLCWILLKFATHMPGKEKHKQKKFFKLYFDLWKISQIMYLLCSCGC
jgi:hypothetical protein